MVTERNGIPPQRVRATRDPTSGQTGVRRRAAIGMASVALCAGLVVGCAQRVAIEVPTTTVTSTPAPDAAWLQPLELLLARVLRVHLFRGPGWPVVGVPPR